MDSPPMPQANDPSLSAREVPRGLHCHGALNETTLAMDGPPWLWEYGSLLSRQCVADGFAADAT